MTPTHTPDCITGKDPWASGTRIFYHDQYVYLRFPWKEMLSLFYKAIHTFSVSFRAICVFQSSLLYKYPWKDRLKQGRNSISFGKQTWRNVTDLWITISQYYFFLMIYGMGSFLLASPRIIGIVIGMYVFRIVVNFKKTSLRCLSYMSCKISSFLVQKTI